jgi:hypothetical protein
VTTAISSADDDAFVLTDGRRSARTRTAVPRALHPILFVNTDESAVLTVQVALAEPT